MMNKETKFAPVLRSSDRPHALAALELIAQGKLEEAKDALTQLILNNPYIDELYELHFFCREEIMRRMIRENVENPQPAQLLSYDPLAKPKPKKELTDEEKFKKNDELLNKIPLSFTLWEERSALLLKQGRLQEALACLEKAKALWPHFFYRWVERAKIFIKMQDYKQAEQELNHALQDLPYQWYDEDLYLDIEEIFLALGNSARAEEFAKKAKEAALKNGKELT